MLKQSYVTYSPRAASLIGGIALALGAGTALAADWAYDPKVTASYEYNDNLRLTDTPGQEIKVSGGSLDAQLLVQGETPRTLFQLTPRLRSTFYPGDEDQETNDQFLRMMLKHKGERSESTLDANYSRVDTLGKYFPSAGVGDGGGLGDPGHGDGVGRSTSQNRETRLGVSPQFSFDVSERHGIEASAGYLDVSFEHHVEGDREDFSNIYGAVAYRYKMSPTRSLAVGAGISHFKQDGSAATDSETVGVEWSSKISETSQWFVRAGASRTESAGDSSSSDSGFAGGAGVRWSFEVTDIFFDLNRSVDPNASGRFVQRDQLRMHVARRLSPMTTIDLGGRFIRDGQTGSDITFEERQYAAGSIGVSWRMSREWSLGGSYTYVWREYESQPDPAESNRVSLGITYEPHRL